MKGGTKFYQNILNYFALSYSFSHLLYRNTSDLFLVLAHYLRSIIVG